MNDFKGIQTTKTGVPVRDVVFNSAVNLWLGFVWDKNSYHPDNKWTTCTWNKSGKCINRNRSELDLSMKTYKELVKAEQAAEIAYFKSHPELNP